MDLTKVKINSIKYIVFREKIEMEKFRNLFLAGFVSLLPCKEVLAQEEGTVQKVQKVVVQTDIAIGYNNLGLYYLERGELRLAKLNFRRAAELDPNFSEAYLNKGIVLTKKGRIPRARLAFNKALRLDSTSTEALNNLGIISGQRGFYRKAIEYFTKALELDPFGQPFETYYNRGMAWSSLKEHNKAIEDFDRAIAQNPNDAEVYNERGIAWAWEGEYEKAIKDFTRVSELDKGMSSEAQYNINLVEKMRDQEKKDPHKFKKVEESYKFKRTVVKRKRRKSFSKHKVGEREKQESQKSFLEH